MHNIDETVTGGAFAAVREPGWHLLGTVVKENVTALKLLQLAHADFPVLRGTIRLDETVNLGDETLPLPVRYQAEDQNTTIIYRVHPETGEAQILGYASAGYPLWTPAQTLVGFGDAVLGQGNMLAATAGALAEGRQVFMSFEVPDEVVIGGVDPVKFYFTVATSFDQSLATRAFISGIRVVCANTLGAGIASAVREMKFRKTARVDLQEKQATGALKLLPEYKKVIKDDGEKLLDIAVTRRKFDEIISSLWGADEDASDKKKANWDRQRGQLLDLFSESSTQENVRNTGWAAVQAVGEHRDWFTKAAGDTEDEKNAVRFARSIGLVNTTGILEPKEAIRKKVLALV